MSFELRDIRDRVAVGDDLFRLEKLSDGRYRLVPAPDSVVEVGTSVDRALLQPMEDEIYRLSRVAPETTSANAGKAIIVQPDGNYGLGEAGSKDAILYTPQTLTPEQQAQARENIGAGDTQIPASNVTAGTLAGQVVANPEAVADITVAQVRNIVCGTADVNDVLDSLNAGDIYFTVEEEA